MVVDYADAADAADADDEDEASEFAVYNTERKSCMVCQAVVVRLVSNFTLKKEKKNRESCICLLQHVGMKFTTALLLPLRLRLQFPKADLVDYVVGGI